VGYIFLFYIFYLGWRISKLFELKSDFSYLRIAAAPTVGIVIFTPFLFILSYLLNQLFPSLNSVLCAVLIFLSLSISSEFMLLRSRFRAIRDYFDEIEPTLTSFYFFKKHWVFLLSVIISVAISAPIFFNALYITDGNLEMKGYMWSDMTLHLGLIASFAKGENIPPEFIAYPFVPINYHFLTHFFVAVVSFVGAEPVRLLNLFNVINFIQISLISLLIGRRLFKSDGAGILGFVLFCFGSSLALWSFLWQHMNQGDLMAALLGFKGWMWQVVFEMWGLFNFNVYINQRHFPFGIAAFGIFFYLLACFTLFDDLKTRGKWPFVLTGLLIGLMPYFHMPTAVSACFLVLMCFILSNKNRKDIFLTGIVAGILFLPQALMWKYGVSTLLSNYPKVKIGYEIGRMAPVAISVYYWKILGFKIVAILAGFFLSCRKGRILFITLVPLFILPNIFQFQHMLYDNNKFLILFLTVANIYAAFPLIYVWRKGVAGKIAACFLLIPLVATGLADYYGVMRQDMVTLPYKNDKLRSWIEHKTEPRSVFLTDTAIKPGYSAYYSVLLSGRRIYVHSIADFEQDLSVRRRKAAAIYRARDKTHLCKILKEEGIEYIVIDNSVRESKDYNLRESFFINNLSLVYKDTKSGILVFSVNEAC
jgi:hypothetical protein